MIKLFFITVFLLISNISYAQNYHKVTDQDTFNSQQILGNVPSVQSSANSISNAISNQQPVKRKQYSLVTPEDFCLEDIRAKDTRPGFYAKPLRNCEKKEVDLTDEEKKLLEEANEKPVTFSKEEQNLFTIFKKKRQKELEKMQNKKVNAKPQKTKQSTKEQRLNSIYRGND